MALKNKPKLMDKPYAEEKVVKEEIPVETWFPAEE